MLLREEIEQSFGNGPAHRPIEERGRGRPPPGAPAAGGRPSWRRSRPLAVLGATYAVTAPGGEGTGATADRRATPARRPTPT